MIVLCASRRPSSAARTLSRGGGEAGPTLDALAFGGPAPTSPGTAAPGPTGLDDAARRELGRFAVAGLGRSDFDDFRASGLDYPLWATQRDAATESTALEVVKWGSLALAGVTGVLWTNKASGDGVSLFADDVLVLRYCTFGLGALGATLFGIDLADVGAPPAALPPAP